MRRLCFIILFLLVGLMPCRSASQGSSSPTVATTKYTAASTNVDVTTTASFSSPTSVAPTGHTSGQTCEEEIATRSCDCDACKLHNNTRLQDACCRYLGVPATILAFEKSSLWVPRLSEFNSCTGARLTITYNGGGQGSEDQMEDDLRQDVGGVSGGGGATTQGAGVYDAYIVQAPWLPAVVDGLENLSPWISSTPELRWNDVNSASREAVSFDGSVRALPLDTDYVALGWRQDVYDRYNMTPPETIEELVEHAEFLNRKDHNDDGVPDWGYCFNNDVNYFYAFLAPLLVTSSRECDNGVCNGPATEQNLFFNATTFEPLFATEAFRYAVRLFNRLLHASNCRDELAVQGKCDRKTAFPTGRCAGVLSMPGTMTQLLLPDGSLSIQPRRDADGNTVWMPGIGLIDTAPSSGGNSTLNGTMASAPPPSTPVPSESTSGQHWGRRQVFPGSTKVYDYETNKVVTCTRKLCPKARPHSKDPSVLVNYAPFFAEAGESYAVRADTAEVQKDITLDFFGWLAELPVTLLPLTGQYRKSQLVGDTQKEQLLNDGWPPIMVEDLFSVLNSYFLDVDEGGNPVQDLLMIGFSEYMGAVRKRLFDDFLTETGFFYFQQPRSGRGGTRPVRRQADDISEATGPRVFEEEFNQRFDTFVETVTSDFDSITNSYGYLNQLSRWRQSLDLAPLSTSELCAIDVIAAEHGDELECASAPSPSNNDDDSDRVALIAALSCCGALLMIVIVSMIVAKRLNQDRLQRQAYAEKLERILQRVQRDIDMMFQGQSQSQAMLDRFEAIKLPSNAFSFKGTIGEGSFGFVRLGTVSFPGGDSVDTAIKQVHEDHDGEEQAILLFEARLLAMLKHPNIIKIVALQCQEAPIMLATEYMRNGSIRHYLSRNATKQTFHVVDLMIAIYGICDALRYLESRRIVHRDVAARNVLVGEDISDVRLADFGMSRRLQDKDYYRKLSHDKVPIKWMPLEAIEQKIFTSASDVWSFGVFMWEVFTFGSVPWSAYSAVETVLAISRGERLPQPNCCPDDVFDVMTSCWHADAEERPTFNQLGRRLRELAGLKRPRATVASSSRHSHHRPSFDQAGAVRTSLASPASLPTLHGSGSGSGGGSIMSGLLSADDPRHEWHRRKRDNYDGIDSVMREVNMTTGQSSGLSTSERSRTGDASGRSVELQSHTVAALAHAEGSRRDMREGNYLRLNPAGTTVGRAAKPLQAEPGDVLLGGHEHQSQDSQGETSFRLRETSHVATSVV